MKRIVIYISVLLCSITQAQNLNSDSFLFEKVYTDYKSSPIFLSESPLGNFTISSLYLNTEKGDLHLGQSPKASTDFGINTYGFYVKDKVNFFGNINIQRAYQSDKAWNLSYDEVKDNGLMPDPQYFAVSKPADWNIQKYDLFGGFSFPIWEKRLDFSVWSVFNLSEKYRTEYDPRPKINTNELTFSGQLGVFITRNHKLAFSGSYGYMGVDNAMGFSDQDSQTPLYVEKYLRWQLGYGTFQLPIKSSTKRRIKTNAFGLAYHHKSELAKLLISLNINNLQSDTYKNNNDNDEDSDIYAKRFSATYSANVNYIRNLETGVLRVNATYSNSDTYNYLQLQKGRSYLNSETNAEVNVHFLKEKNRLNSEFSFGLAYEQAQQRDVISLTSTENARLVPSVLVAKEYRLSENVIKPFVEVAYVSPLNNKLVNQNIEYHKVIAPTDYAGRNVRLFYDEVVYADYRYFNAKQYKIHFGTNLKTKVSKSTTLIWGISSTYRTTFSGKDRYYLASHLSFYY